MIAAAGDVLGNEGDPPRLVHFDLWQGNLLLEGAEGAEGARGLSGVIDAERMFWGDPVASSLDSLFDDIEKDADFLAGVRGGRGRCHAHRLVRSRLELYRCYLYLIMLVEAVPQATPPAVGVPPARRGQPTASLDAVASALRADGDRGTDFGCGQREAVRNDEAPGGRIFDRDHPCRRSFRARLPVVHGSVQPHPAVPDRATRRPATGGRHSVAAAGGRAAGPAGPGPPAVRRHLRAACRRVRHRRRDRPSPRARCRRRARRPRTEPGRGDEHGTDAGLRDPGTPTGCRPTPPAPCTSR
ncbi:hypothetical protein SHIRM173S_03949 [Streptomyces hirsutus]